MKQKIVYENGITFLPGAKAVATSYKKTEDAATEKVVIPKDYKRPKPLGQFNQEHPSAQRAEAKIAYPADHRVQ